MKVSAIQAEHLAEVGQFLHDNLNRRFTPERWISSLTHHWAETSPNFGMQLRDGEQLVGVFCAIYSDQQINGRLEQFCNPHSWCVLESHRRQGIGLVLNLVKQRGYHFTMFTPNPKVTEVFLGLKFKNLDDRQYRCLNLPGLTGWRKAGFASSQLETIAASLSGQDRLDFDAHRDIPWLNFVVFGLGEDLCWVIYKPSHWKRMRSAWVLHVSHAGAFERHNGLLRQHLRREHGLMTLVIEARWLQAKPAWSLLERRTQPKLFQSASLLAGQVRDLYSELMSLDV